VKAKEAAKAFRAWAEENRLISSQFPTVLELQPEQRDEAFDQLKITAASEQTLRSKLLTSIGFNEIENKIYVLTGKKLTLGDLKKLPEVVSEDIEVHYIHAGQAQAGAPSGGHPHYPYYVTPTGKYSCGSSIHPAKHIGAGTFGCLVKNNEGELYGLSNNHVTGLCNYALDGEKILAPGHLDITAKDLDPFTIGFHYKSLQFVPGVPDNVDVTKNIDAALFKICSPSSVSSYQGAAYDTPPDVLDIEAGMMVEKIGRTTGRTFGKVISEMVGPMMVNYTVPGVGNQASFFEPVYLVRESLGGTFSAGGDSGSLVTVERNGNRYAVGLVFAGDTQGNSYVLPLKPILEAFDVTIVSGHNT
jgi:hypothetical protein